MGTTGHQPVQTPELASAELPPGPADQLAHPQPPSTSQPIATSSSGHPPKGRKFRAFLPKNRGSGRSTPTPTLDEEEDDEWLLEGTSSNGHVNAGVSVGREASTLGRSVDALSLGDSDNTGSATVDRTEKRMSKGRALAKKTSRLFGRSANGHHDEQSASSAAQAQQQPANSTLGMPPGAGVRQSSFSSTASGDSGPRSAKHHWNISRTNSNGRGSPPHRGSQDSSSQQPSSWHPPPAFPLRRTSSSQDDSAHVPQPQPRSRESSHHLSTSVPSMSRNGGSAPPTHPRQEASLPGRVTSWWSNLLPTGEPGGSPVHQDVSQHPPSPLRKGPSSAAASLLNAARQKAVGGVRYLLDSDAQPDKCEETMWVMGVAHPGWTPSLDDHNPFFTGDPTGTPPSWTTRIKEGSGTHPSPPTSKSFANFFSPSSANLVSQFDNPPSTPPSTAVPGRNGKSSKEPLKWPEQFYDDFRSRVWCTYRSQYAPIIPYQPGALLLSPESYFGAFSKEGSTAPPSIAPSTTPRTSPWSWVKGGDGLTSDAGWGCMLRTGQSMLANALIHLHLGRGWRVPFHRPSLSPENPLELAELEAYATYVRLLTWFLDDPSPVAPFSVHRMALVGKELGKEVGEWFGPSTAAGALKTLANSFPMCGLSVATAVDGTIYKSDVYAASHITSKGWTPGETTTKQRPTSMHRTSWGGKPVLILIGLRLGVDGVNPIYYDSIKALFTFPQSVGIAGGRPSSSYYFVASQGSSLFYLDPHVTRNAIPLNVPPVSVATSDQPRPAPAAHPEPTRRPVPAPKPVPKEEAADDFAIDDTPAPATTTPTVDVVNVDETPAVEPSPAPKKTRRFTGPHSLKIRPGALRRDSDTPASPTTPTRANSQRGFPVSPSPARPSHPPHSLASSTSSLPSHSPLPVDPQTAWYANAYPDSSLRSFHCDRVKKLPLSGLDPSMLLGFLCTSEAEFDDLCDRVSKLPQKIFIVQDEPPVWSEDEGLESVSEPDASEPDDNDDDSDDEVTGVLSPAMPRAQLPDDLAADSANTTVDDSHDFDSFTFDTPSRSATLNASSSRHTTPQNVGEFGEDLSKDPLHNDATVRRDAERGVPVSDEPGHIGDHVATAQPPPPTQSVLDPVTHELPPRASSINALARATDIPTPAAAKHDAEHDVADLDHDLEVRSLTATDELGSTPGSAMVIVERVERPPVPTVELNSPPS